MSEHEPRVPAVAEPPRRLDVKAIVALNICNCAHFYALCSIFSYAAFLCVDAGWVDRIDHAGFMAGLLPTMVMAGRIATSWAWGMLSDRIGGRACLRLCLASIAVGNLLFGFATQPWSALLVRFIFLGACNGYVALIGPLSQVIGGAERQSEVLTLVFASGPVIQMVGPALGGLLYGSLTSRFPAILPSVIGASIALVGFAAVSRFLPSDTNGRASEATCNSKPQPETEELEAAAVEMDSATTPRPEGVKASSSSSSSSRGSSSSSRGSSSSGSNGGSGCGSRNGTGTDQTAAAPSLPPSPPSSSSPSTRATSSLAPVLCAHPLPLVALVRSTSGLLLFGMFDVVPLWLAASRGAGGLAMDEKMLGAILASASLAMLPWVLQPQGRFIRHFGVRFALRSSLLVCAVVYSVTVPLTLAADAMHPRLGQLTCVLLIAIGNAASGTASTASFAATNNAAAHTAPSRVGAVSGVHVTAEAVGKMLGPAVGAPLLGALLSALHPTASTTASTTAPSLLGSPHAAATAVTALRHGMTAGLVSTEATPMAADGADGADGDASASFALNGAAATMGIFSALSFLVFLASLALPRPVDGPRRSSLLPRGSRRSDSSSAAPMDHAMTAR